MTTHVTYPLLILAGTLIGFGTLSAQEKEPPGAEASYSDLLSYWKAQRPSGTEVITDAEVRETGNTTESKAGNEYIIFKEKLFKSAKPIRELVMQDHSVGFVYPGSLLWTKPIIDGQLIPLPSFPNRVPVKVSVTGITEGSDLNTFIHDGSFFDFQNKSTPIIRSIQATSPQLDLKIGVGRTLKSALLDMGLSVSYWGNKFSVSSRDSNIEESSYAVLSLNEVYFTMTTETPDVEGFIPASITDRNSPEGFFILSQMKNNGEIGYVRRVNYGRRILVAISSSSSKSDLKRALRLSAGGFGVKVDGNIEQNTKQIWEGMNAEVLVVGGRVTPALHDAATGGFDSLLKNINTYLKDTAAYTPQSGAVPISFEVRYISDGEAFSNYETTEFAGMIPSRRVRGEENIQINDFKVLLTHEDARLMRSNDDLHTDDWTKVSVSHNFSVSPDQRSVLLYVEMNAIELEENESEKPKTHFRTAKTITAFQLAQDDKRKISNVLANPPKHSESHNLKGELHGFFNYDDGVVGALRDVRLSIDGPGGDRRHQGLQALTSFTVEIAREE
jgi:hypothetical protein